MTTARLSDRTSQSSRGKALGVVLIDPHDLETGQRQVVKSRAEHYVKMKKKTLKKTVSLMMNVETKIIHRMYCRGNVVMGGGRWSKLKAGSPVRPQTF